jgi:ATP-binding cassette subfamily C protein LapB
LKLSSAKSTKLMQARSNLVVDVAEGIATIKANQAEGRFLRQWDIVSDHIGIGAQTSRKWTELPGSMSGFVVQFVTVMVVIIGVFQIKAGVMTSGAMIAVTMLTGRAMVPVSNAIGVVSKAYQSMAQLAGLAQILTMEAERDISDPAIARRPIVGRICLNDVTCRYHEAAETSLTNVSLSIERGEKIAIIGRSGSGKSTLLRAISGMLPVESGAITVDGHMMSQFAAAHLRKSIVYAGQDAGLFNASIWENILLGMEEPEEQVVERAITVSCLDRFVSRSVEGFTRNIGPGGCKLSGGQRQSLVLARALIRDPGTLLLDEPTASMDINAEQGVINGLRTSMNGRTLIIATHRMALLEVVDRIILVEGGKIVADRPQREMLAKLRDQYQASPARAAA